MRVNPREFRAAAIAAVVATFAVSSDLEAQRFQRRQRPGGESAPAAAPSAETPKERKVEKWTAIVGGDVHIGDGNVIRGATVLIGDDKIEKVGHDLEIPENATRIDATGLVVAPGFCLVKASGIGGPGNEVRDDLNPYDPSIKLGLAAGITSYLWTANGGSNTPGGKSAVVKLAYGDLAGMVGPESSVVSMRVPLDPASMANLRKSVRQAREHLEKVREFEAKPGAKPEEKPKVPSGTEELIALMTGQKRLWISQGGGGFPGMFGGSGRRGGGGGGGFGTSQIRQAMEIAELIGAGVVLDGPTEGWVVPDEIAATGSMAIVSPRTKVEADPGRPEDSGSNLAQAAILDAAGVPVAVTVPGGSFGGPSLGTGGILGQDLNTPTVDAAYAIRGGYPWRKGLRTLTLDSARIMGAERRLGSLEAGKDADVLILDGDPLNYKTFVQTALVNGKVVYRKDDEPFYRHIRR
ncbi:MAG: amidohydrolase family protein [Planctomycetota bacterium]